MKKTIVITGASDGIGRAAATMLAEHGHRVILVGRNPEKTKAIASKLGAPYHIADFSRLSDVATLAKDLWRYDRIDVLCNNAGGVQNQRALTEDGIERTFQINVLGAFLLTRLLLPHLLESGATVIQTTSIAANLFADDRGDFQSENAYQPMTAYGNAKLYDIYFTKELDRRYGDRGLAATAFEPGVVRTNFASESTPFLKFMYHSPLKYFFTISPQKSAHRLVRLAEGEAGKDFQPAEIYSDRAPMKRKFLDPSGAAARALWDACETWCRPFLEQ